MVLVDYVETSNVDFVGYDLLRLVVYRFVVDSLLDFAVLLMGNWLGWPLKGFWVAVLANLLVISDNNVRDLCLFHGYVGGIAHLDIEVIHGAGEALRLRILSMAWVRNVIDKVFWKALFLKILDAEDQR